MHSPCSRHNSMEWLNDWIKDEKYIQTLKTSFKTASPYPHIVIDNFFKSDIATALEQAFPIPTLNEWNVYDNPIERKLTFDKDLTCMEPEILALMWKYLQTEMVAIVADLTGIQNLESDKYFHGAGFHYHPPGGKLEMHLDYSIHPITGKERRINLIVYMNPHWDADTWNGHLILTDEFKTCTKYIAPQFNRAIIMSTSDDSWHGMPQLVACPAGYGRKSIAVYYMSDAENPNSKRHKAKFRPLMGLTEDIKDEATYLKLCAIRDNRRLTEGDIPTDWMSTMNMQYK